MHRCRASRSRERPRVECHGRPTGQNQTQESTVRLPQRIRRWACSLAIALVAAGCGQKLQPLGLANKPPEIRLRSPISAPTSLGDRYVHSLAWQATDPDGRVDHYLVAHSPNSLERVDEGWARTNETSQTISWRRVEAGALSRSEDRRDYDLFAVRAVDDRGALSPPATRAYFGDNIAPTVQILTPYPNPFTDFGIQVPPSFHVHWDGSDPDGKKGRPRQYKFKLFGPPFRDFPIEVMRADPDSLGRFYGPRFATWDSLPGDSEGITLRNLDVHQSYFFVVTAIDAQGAYDPVFSFRKNMLQVLVEPGT
jgi:hypothetical protein